MGAGRRLLHITPLNRHQGREVPTWGRGARRCRAPKRKNAGTGEEQPGVPVRLEVSEQDGQRRIIVLATVC